MNTYSNDDVTIISETATRERSAEVARQAEAPRGARKPKHRKTPAPPEAILEREQAFAETYRTM